MTVRRALVTAFIAVVGMAIAILEVASAGDGGLPRLTVSAASSLKGALTEYAEQFDDAEPRLSFAGSDELAAQIRQGARPDVYAAASLEIAEALHTEGLVEKPVVFATNRIVLAVPAGTTSVASLADLGRPGVTIAMGSPSVPAGAYTRELLARLGARMRARILANVRSHEPSVTGVIGKLTQAAVDAGFVYETDVVAAQGAVRAIELPEALQPSVTYAVAVVRNARQPRLAREFAAGLLTRSGRSALRAAGFEPPPR